MIVGSATTAAAAVAAPPADEARRAGLNYDAFLSLLIAEMKNQDPTQPTDPSQSLSQLASFSSVEQTIKINSKLDSLLAISTLGQSGNYIGHTITSADGTVSGKISALEITTGGAAAILEDGRSVTVETGVKIA
ncbi:MAG: flagellar hook assembly protein FlgD [Rhizobiales bacterium]|nr:flagellar hook assembly protein FlgD [Hyphomicrobiales bacterium]MBI3672777.1 flagellar hook assembly protein FlgD [Hyphomicrobiales bacterium]